MNADTGAPPEATILLLTSATGSGHDTRAQAFASWVDRLAPDCIRVIECRPLEEGSSTGGFGVDLYNAIQRNLPALHIPYWWIVEGLGCLQRERVLFGRRRYLETVATFQPDAIVSFHDFLNRGFFEDARRATPGVPPVCVTYCGEHSAGRGFSRHWVNPTADLFYCRVDAVCDRAAALGLPRERIRLWPTCFAPGVREILERDTAPEDSAFPASFRADGFRLLLTAAGRGANHHLAILQAMVQADLDIQVIAACGRNEPLRQRLLQWSAVHPRFPIAVEGFSRRIPVHLARADAVISRGGANLTAEAIHARTVPIFNGLGGVMPQEWLTINRLLRDGIADLARTTDQVVDALKRLVHNPSELARRKQALAQLRQPDNSAEAVGQILDAARAVARQRNAP